VDPVVNPTLLPVASTTFNPLSPFGPPRPMTLFKTSDYWVQGVQLGVGEVTAPRVLDHLA